MDHQKTKRGPRAKPGEQGLSHLGTWRVAFSEDVKRRSQQKRENRRPHRLRGQEGTRSSVLGTTEAHWSEPAKPGRRSRAYATAPGSHPKHAPVIPGSTVLDRRLPVRRGKR